MLIDMMPKLTGKGCAAGFGKRLRLLCCGRKHHNRSTGLISTTIGRISTLWLVSIMHSVNLVVFCIVHIKWEA